jgi:hypothetical protein
MRRRVILVTFPLLLLGACRSYVIEEAAQRAISQERPGVRISECHETSVVFQGKGEGPFYLCHYDQKAESGEPGLAPNEGCFTIDLDAEGHAVAKGSARCFDD